MTEMVRNIDMDMLYWGDKNVSQLKEINSGRREVDCKRSTAEMFTEYRMESRNGVYENERERERERERGREEEEDIVK